MTPVRVDVVSIFPEYLAPLDLSLIGKARRDGILDVRVHDLRDFAHDRHRTVDDSPFGGGAGMVMKPEPWAEALDAVVASGPAGTPWCRTSSCPGRAGCRSARRWRARWPTSRGWRSPAGATRASTSASTSTPPTRMPVTVVSLGDYVLNGGEVAVLAMVEAVGRLLPGVVGNAESLVEESHEDGLLEYPVYTRPASWDDAGTVRDVPAVLLSRRPCGDRRLAARAAPRAHGRAAPRPAAVLRDRRGAGRPRRAGRHPCGCRRAARAAARLLGARGAGGAGSLGGAAAGRGARRRRGRAGGVDDVCRPRAVRGRCGGAAGRIGARAGAPGGPDLLGGGPADGGARPPGPRAGPGAARAGGVAGARPA